MHVFTHAPLSLAPTDSVFSLQAHQDIHRKCSNSKVRWKLNAVEKKQQLQQLRAASHLIAMTSLFGILCLILGFIQSYSLFRVHLVKMQQVQSICEQ